MQGHIIAQRDDRSGEAISEQAREFSRRLKVSEHSRLPMAAKATVNGLHTLIAKLRPSEEEFRLAIEFLTAVGHSTDTQRQEWVLLADVLGVSSLIQDQSHPRPAEATPNTVAGPFYRSDAPQMPLGANISRDGKGERLLVTGRIAALDGQNIGGAIVECWQANAEGVYENQEPDRQPEFNLRGRFQANAEGRFRFVTVKPKGYALPSDGPVGRLIAALGLCLERPAHIHLRVTAEGFETLTTHIFDCSDPAIGRDAIFGVKPELMAEFRALEPYEGKKRHALDLNLVLCRSGRAQSEALGGDIL